MVTPLRVFFFNDTATTEIYTLSLHDALPICRPYGKPKGPGAGAGGGQGRGGFGGEGRGGAGGPGQIRRAQGWNPVTVKNPIPASPFKKKNNSPLVQDTYGW